MVEDARHARTGTAADVVRTVESETDTPVRFLDLDAMRESYRHFRTAWEDRFPSVRIAYSFKTNPLGAVTRLFEREGALAEVVSGMELEWALGDGYEDGNIVFNGPVKYSDELETAIDHDALVNIDSPSEVETIEKLTEAGQTARIGVRVNADIGEESWSRFGVSPDAAIDIIRSAAESSALSPVCVHQHIGSNVASTERYEESCRALRPVIRALFEHTAPEECFIDVGGGFPVSCTRPADDEEWNPPSIPEFVDAVSSGLGPLPKRGATVVAEPGRFLVEPHGHLVCRVIDRYPVDDRDSLVIDGGTNLVPSIYVYERPVSFVPSNGSAFGSEHTTEYDIYGPLCLQSDRLGAGVTGPDDVVPGDYVVIHGVGGYDIPGAYSWIRPRPAIVARFEDRVGCVRTADTARSLRARERRPFST